MRRRIRESTARQIPGQENIRLTAQQEVDVKRLEAQSEPIVAKEKKRS